MAKALALPRGLTNLSWPLSLLILLGCLVYTYAGALLVPYSGLAFGSDWVVTQGLECAPSATWCLENQGLLEPGDRLVQIGDLTRTAFRKDRTQVAFSGYLPGSQVPITFERAGQVLTTLWRMPERTLTTQFLFIANALIYLPFWAAGTIILVALRPRDARWRLLVAFNYLTALWLATGLVSYSQILHSSLILHALTWALVPVYLHLHLMIPSPFLSRGRRFILSALYTAAALGAVFELFQIMPRGAFNLALLLTVVGSLGVLLLRLLRHPSPPDRVALHLMVMGVVLALGPGTVLVVIPSLIAPLSYANLAGNIAVLAVPNLPFFYLYAIYKHRLGDLEYRANRFLSLYSFVLIYATAFVLAFSFGDQWLGLPVESLGFSLIVSILFLAVALPLRVRYQRLIDLLAYGGTYTPEEIVQVFSNQISAVLDRQELVALLDQLMQRLLIRESALYLLRNGEPNCVYASGIKSEPHPRSLRALDDLLAKAGQYRPEEESRRGEFAWVRLPIVLKMGSPRVGIWLLGHRDPDDYYPARDIALLNVLANQITPVLENIRLFDETRTAAHQFSLLYDAGLALNSVLKPLDQLQYLSELAMKTLHADRAAFFSYDEARNELLFEFGIGFSDASLQLMARRHFLYGEKGGLIGWVAKNRLPINVPDVRTNVLWTGIDPDIRSGLWTPVERKKELRGVMTVYSTTVNAFAARDERLLVLFANQAAVALENARLFEAEKTRREELAGLYDLSRALADAAFDFDAILNLIARRAVETIHSTFAHVILLEGSEFVVRTAAPLRLLDGDLGIGRREPTAAHPLYLQVLKENQLTIVNLHAASLSEYERESIFLGIAQTACLVPLVAGDRGLGLIVIGEARRREREPFTFEKLSLARSIGDLMISALHHAQLYTELEKSYLQTVLTLAQAVDAKDTYTADHALRLAEMAMAVGRELHMTPRELEDLRFGAILHDIGKIGVHDAILQKPGKLSPEEQEAMRQHPLIGARILAPVPRLANAARVVRHHHEWYDGSGYPDGLAGEEIPLGARILTIVDSYSAIVDARVYKEARSQDEAMTELQQGIGTQFDPRIAELFLRLVSGKHI